MKALLFLLSLLAWGLALAAPPKATWDVSPATNIAGYRVLAGTVSGQYTITNTAEGRLNNSVTLSNSAAGVIYVVAVAYTFDGKQSAWSSPEITFTNLDFAPKGLKLSATIQAGRTPSGPWTNLVNLAVPMPLVEDQRFFRTRLLLEELP